VVALALIGLLPGTATLLRVLPELLAHEGLPIALASFGDRLRLEREPSIAPSLLASDQPQTFFVRATGAREVRVRLAEGVAELGAEALGEGAGPYLSSPMRPVFIWAWNTSSCASIGRTHDAPCSVSTKRNRGKRSKTPPRIRWLSARREKNVVSAIQSTPATGYGP
jgi:hypothetical protein